MISWILQKRISIVVLLFFTITAAGCSTVPITGRKQLVFIPSAELFSIGIDNYNQILSKEKISQDTARVKMVRDVGNRIALAAEQFLREKGMDKEIKYYNWEFNLIDNDKTVNAFALPGGKVAVYTGILFYTQDDAGLATVISHEIAHVIANHGGERMSQILLAQFGAITLSQAAKEEKEKTRQYLLFAYGVGMNLGVVLPYSRLHEKEADHIGLILMARAGYDPRAAIPFWERMNGLKGSRTPEFLSTHPAPQTRIEDIRNEMPEALIYYK